MGQWLSSVFNSLIGKQEVRILMVGLDAAGKTTILYKLKLGEVVTTQPTIGFNVETVEYKNLKFTMWDVGGQEKLRRLWHYYYQNTHGIIFVVDSNDRDRIGAAKAELSKMLVEDELRNAVLLVFANKQDLPNAMSTTEVTEKLGLQALRQRTWYIQGCCGKTSQGLFEGLDWLSGAIQKVAFSQKFNTRLNQLKDSQESLGCEEYRFLRSHLQNYRKLQACYAVKQTDVERARKAANLCGLEFTGKKEVRILLMVGLDAAGKTTILYKLKLGEVVTTQPTIGFNVETVEYKNLKFTMWDVGGQGKLRPLWRHYYQNTNGIIFVVDSNDRDRIGAAKEELSKMLVEDELRNAVLLVFANKQDLPNAMSTTEVTETVAEEEC
eukprot:gene13390-9216_t